MSVNTAGHIELTPWNSLLENLKVSQRFNTFSQFYGPQIFINSVYNSPLPVPNLSQMNPIHAL